MTKKSVIRWEYLTTIKTKGKKELYFISWKRQNQIIECIAEDISTTIHKEIHQMYSIPIYSTFDFSRKEQTSFISSSIMLMKKPNLFMNDYLL